MALIYDKNKLDARKKQLNFVDKSIIEGISFDEMTKFILSLVKENPYIDINNPPEVQFVDMPINVHASYTYGQHVLRVSTKYIEKCCKDKQLGLCEMTKTIGHELRHSRQFHVYDLARANADFDCSGCEINKNTLDALRGIKLSDAEVEKTIELLRPYLNPSYLKEFDNAPPVLKGVLPKQLSFGLYADQQHERDARFGGIEFAETMLKAWRNDPEANNLVQIMSNSALLSFIPNARSVDLIDNNSIKRFKKLEQAIKEIPIEKMAELEEGLFDDFEDLNYIQNAETNERILTFCNRTILKSKSIEDLFKVLDFAADNESPLLFNSAIENIDKKCLADPNSRKQMQTYLNKFLVSETASYMPTEYFALLSQLFNQEQTALSIETLVKEGDFTNASKILHIFNTNKLIHDKEKVAKVLIDLKDIVNDALCDYYNKIESTTSLRELNELDEAAAGLAMFINECRSVLLNRNYDYMKFIDYTDKIDILISKKLQKFKDDFCNEQDEEVV